MNTQITSNQIRWLHKFILKFTDLYESRYACTACYDINMSLSTPRARPTVRGYITKDLHGDKTGNKLRIKIDII